MVVVEAMADVDQHVGLRASKESVRERPADGVLEMNVLILAIEADVRKPEGVHLGVGWGGWGDLQWYRHMWCCVSCMGGWTGGRTGETLS